MKHIRSLTLLHDNRILSAAIYLFLTSGIVSAQATHASFVPFNDFVENTRAANPNEFLSQATANVNVRVKDAQSFEEMRQHILGLYEGVNVSHSFVLDGDHFDCVPVEQQPGVRMQGLKRIATPPLAPAPLTEASAAGSAQKAVGIASQLRDYDAVDEFGNSRACEEHTIPMRRVTLDDMSRFATLKDFFEKGPEGSGQPPSLTPEGAATVQHKYSYMLQSVLNLGQTSTINLWSPHVNTGAGEIFSLAQSWTIGTKPITQTAEVGWQNFPAQYGGQNSRLFIYWTADGYNQTGCYNLTCPGFVQTASGWAFGAGFSHYSKVGGTQYEFRAEYELYEGNWWLGLGTPDGVTWVGYYPATLYGSGAMAKHSQLIEFGSESVGSTIWPPEGSGKWASAGFGKAAYQRELFYLSYSKGNMIWDLLTVEQPSPNCYSIAGPYFGGYNPPSNDWGTYFYFGGPGGKGC
jgi:Neprosin